MGGYFSRSLQLVIPTLAGLLMAAGDASAACTGTSPNWTSSVDFASLSACVTGASAGDTIRVSTGVATYANTINISKRLTIIGAGPTSTVINANERTVFVVSLSGGDFRLSGIGFTGHGGGSNLETCLIAINGTWNSMRLDHLAFTNIADHSINIGQWDRMPAHPKVLFDHINYSSTLSGGFGRFLKIAGNNNTWKMPDQYGTDFFVFIEDSTFSWSTANINSSVTDTEHGVRLVVRYNTITNGGVQVHDTGSTPAAKGQRATEIYNNTFNCSSAAVCSDITAIGVRGGGFIIHDNTMSTNFGELAWPQIYRATIGGGYLGGSCNGTPIPVCDTPTYYHCSGGDHAACGYPGDNVCSGKGTCQIAATSAASCPAGASFISNVDRVDGGNGASGYPCRHQTGWGMESADGRTQQPSPVYWYNNKDQNSNVLSPTLDISPWFVRDRDYCLHDPSTACGTKAAWTYTTYQYPHPLQTGGGGGFAPMAPTSLTVK